MATIPETLAADPNFLASVADHGVNECKKLFFAYSAGAVQRAYALVKKNQMQNGHLTDSPQENADMTQTQVQIQAPVEITVPITGHGADLLKPAPKINLNDCIILNLTLTKPGIRKRISTDEIEVDTDKSALSVSKEIIDSEELKKIRVIDVQMSKYVKEHALPAGTFLKGGMSIIAPATLVMIDQALQGMILSRKDLINDFMKAYPKLITDAKKRLKGLFNDADYPASDRLRAAFDADVSYQSFTVASSLKSISAAIAKREEEKAAEKAHKAAAAIEESLAAAALDLVTKIREKLSPTDTTGKGKKFRDNTIDVWSKFFTELKDRNITGSTNLEQVADLGLAALKGVDVKKLKNSDDAKLKLAQAFDNLAPILEGSLQDRPKRAMNLD